MSQKIEIDTEKMKKEMPALQKTAELVQQIQQGTVPSNVQMHQTLEEAKSALDSAKQSSNVNKTGAQILEHTKEVVTSTQEWIKDKNEGDRLRKMAETASATATEASAKGRNIAGYTKKKIDTSDLQKEAKALLKETSSLFSELSSSQSFRNSLWEFFTLIGMFLSDSDSVQEFLDKYSDKLGSKAEEWKEQLKSTIDKAADTGKQKLDTITQQGKSGISEAKQQTQVAHARLQQGDQEGLKQDVQKKGQELSAKGQQKTQELVDTGKQKVSETMEQGKQKMEEWKERGQQTLEQWRRGEGLEIRNIEGKPLTDQQVKQLQSKFMELLRQISGHPSSKRATQALLGMIDRLYGLVKFAQKQVGTEGLSAIQNDRNAQQLLNHTRKLVERMAGGKSLDPLIQQFKQFVDALQNDQDARALMWDIRTFLRSALENPEKLTQQDFQQKGSDLFERGRQLLNRKNTKYRHLGNRIIDEGRNFIYAIQEDPKNVQLQQSVQKLVGDIFSRDANGHLQLRQEALQQLRLLLAGIVQERLRVLPLPPLHIQDETRDVHISNLTLNIAEFAPEQIRIDQSSSIGIQLKEAPSAQINRGTLTLHIDNMRTHLQNVEFTYKGLSFPYLEDAGLLELDVGGDGMSLTLALELNTEDYANPLSVASVDVDIDKLDIKVQDTKRDWFNNMVLWLWSGVLKRRVEKTIQLQLYSFVDSLNENIAAATSTLQESKLPSMLQGASIKEGLTKVKETAQQAWDKTKEVGEKVSTQTQVAGQKAKGAVADTIRPETKVTRMEE